jgi:RNA polymerase sigma factor (sigma-70 family)
MQHQNLQTAAGKIDCNESDKEKLFNYLYTGFFDKVVHAARLFCGSEETAKDCTQNVFMRVWKQLDRLTVKLQSWTNWENYLFIMARNEVLNHKRKLGFEVKGKAAYYRSTQKLYSWNGAMEKECAGLYNKAIKSLSKRQSEIYILNYYGVKRDDIAEKLGVTAATVSNTLNDARRKMREYVCEQLLIKVKKVKTVSAQ